MTSLADRFQGEVEAVGGTVRRARDLGEASKVLREVIGGRRAVTWSRAEFSGWDVDWLWEEGGCVAWSGGGSDAAERFRTLAASSPVGITTAQAAIASTGTLVLASGPGRPRSVSLLPPTHVALLRAERLRERMGEAFAEILRSPGGPPSATLLVTGPSRTSDIENDLTIGVHGPGEVVVVLLV
jgi:L-lactate utilization protein LutC